MIEERIKVLNWNIGGAKYLEKLSCYKENGSLKENVTAPENWQPGRGRDVEYREQYKHALMAALRRLCRQCEPDVVTLQEVVQYSTDGDSQKPEHIIDEIKGYHYMSFRLIDTEQFSARPKWSKVIQKGGWRTNPNRPFFAQGNGFLVKDTCEHYPLWSLPKGSTCHGEYPDNISRSREHIVRAERVDLQTGLYFGDRNTEPRVALVLHLMLSPGGKPLDVFVINLHLTTLGGEREGIPEIDEKASTERLEQLRVVLDGIVSRYNEWRRNGYRVGDRKYEFREKLDTADPKERHNPIWVIAGDFNFTRTSAEYQYLRRRNFMDLIRGDDSTKSSGLGKDPTLVVDYVFAGPQFYSLDPQLAEQKIGENHVMSGQDWLRISDHYPIVADVPIVVED